MGLMDFLKVKIRIPCRDSKICSNNKVVCYKGSVRSIKIRTSIRGLASDRPVVLKSDKNIRKAFLTRKRINTESMLMQKYQSSLDR